MEIILASASPRRRELLALAGYEFTVSPADCDETLPDNITPENAVKLLAEKKADAVSSLYKNSTVIASDTVVALGNTILGKPKDANDAFKMLSMLSGRTHSVFTGVCIISNGRKEIFAEETEVEFYPLSDDEIIEYIKTNEPMDKAGAYGIQGKGSLLVKGIKGDYFNVVGLPLARTVRAIRKITD